MDYKDFLSSLKEGDKIILERNYFGTMMLQNAIISRITPTGIIKIERPFSCAFKNGCDRDFKILNPADNIEYIKKFILQKKIKEQSVILKKYLEQKENNFKNLNSANQKDIAYYNELESLLDILIRFNQELEALEKIFKPTS